MLSRTELDQRDDIGGVQPMDVEETLRCDNERRQRVDEKA
jgi:hypothetical protein